MVKLNIILNITIVTAIVLLLLECNNPVDKNKDFSFFVAGHVYGTPETDNVGVHPPFRKFLETMGRDSTIDFGVYTGDIVKDATEKDWNEIDYEIKTVFGKPIHFAVGNHDIVNRELYMGRYGNTYKTFDYKGNRFIFLDGNIDHWNISGDQFLFFKESISNVEDIHNVFIFSHQVLWWRWDNKYKDLKLNSHEGFKAFPNYWDNVHPLLDTLDITVDVFSGDVGAADWASNFMYDQIDNVHLIASGMGENKGDNFIEVEGRCCMKKN